VNPLDAILTVLISAAPIAELRGGIPFALARGGSPAAAFCLAIFGNLTVVPILFLGLRSGERLLRRTTFGRRLVDSVFARVRRRASAIDRYGALGLFLLVAIPLPGTGAWTGAIAASFFGIPPRRASIPIVLGVLAAGIVVLLASLGVIRVVTIL